MSDLVRADSAPAIPSDSMDVGGMIQLAQAMAASGFFANARDANKALAVMMIGREMGIGPAASLNGINVINGKPQLGANLMAAKIKASGKYNYRVVEHSETVCEIEFYEGKEAVGKSRFSAQDAQTAGYTRNPVYKSNPRNMLFARAMSNGAKWYTPDAFGGIPVYHEGELEMGANQPPAAVPQALPETASVDERTRNAGLYFRRTIKGTPEQLAEFKDACDPNTWPTVALDAEQAGILTFVGLMRYAKEGVVPESEDAETTEWPESEEPEAVPV